MLRIYMDGNHGAWHTCTQCSCSTICNYKTWISSTEEWIKKCGVHTHTGILLRHRKTVEIMPSGNMNGTRVIILMEVRIQRQISNDIIHMWNVILKSDRNELNYKTEKRLTDI